MRRVVDNWVDLRQEGLHATSFQLVNTHETLGASRLDNCPMSTARSADAFEKYAGWLVIRVLWDESAFERALQDSLSKSFSAPEIRGYDDVKLIEHGCAALCLFSYSMLLGK